VSRGTARDPPKCFQKFLEAPGDLDYVVEGHLYEGNHGNAPGGSGPKIKHEEFAASVRAKTVKARDGRENAISTIDVKNLLGWP
jgi:hypothetical protein